MDRPSKKDIKAALDKLKEKPTGPTGIPQQDTNRLTPKKSSQRIRKQGI